MEASQAVDENESRRQQVQVGNTVPTESTRKLSDSVIAIIANENTTYWHINSYYLVEKLKSLQGYRNIDCYKRIFRFPTL